MATVTLPDTQVNLPIKLPFTSVNLATGLASFNNVRFLIDGVNTVIAYTTAEIGNGLYVMTFTPAVTGLYTIFIEQTIAGTVNIVTKPLYTYLKNLEDEALGSWSWSKTAGTLTLTRQDGNPLATFSVADDLTTASRQRS